MHLPKIITSIPHALSRRIQRVFLIAVVTSSAGALTGCGEEGEGEDTIIPPSGTGTTEVSSRQPRVALTYDGGVLVVDATSLEPLSDFQLAGFNRLNSVGDERHVAVSTTGGWALVDTGAWTMPHEDHFHHYTSAPNLSPVIVEATTPGHVVFHDGYTVLFDDGTGKATAIEVDEWTEAVADGHAHTFREYMSDVAHHGVAVLTKEGELLVTRSDRTGAMLLDANDQVLAMADNCPGVHGETAFEAANGSDYMMVGCQDGVLVFQGHQATKIASPDTYGRIGNQFSSEGSNIVLGDYRNDPEAGLAVSLIALVDVSDSSLRIVNPFEGTGATTTWRGPRRGEKGEVLVLGTDGALRVIDPVSGTIDRTVTVIGAWQVPDAWQTAHPALEVVAGHAYVTEPSTGTLHVVDYERGTVESSSKLGIEMNEIAGVEG